MDKNRGKTSKSSIFAGLSFYHYDACSKTEELLQRQNVIREIKQQGGKCFTLYNAYRRSKYCIALCDPSCRTFVKSEAKDFVKKEKRDLYSLEFVRDSIRSRELKNLNEYKLQFKQVCSQYDAMELMQNRESFCKVQEMHKECDWGVVKSQGFKALDSDGEDSDAISAMSSYAESMSSLSEDEHESYTEDVRNSRRDIEVNYFRNLYLEPALDPPNTQKHKPVNLFKGITFYIHPPEKKYKQHNFLGLIKSHGGRIATETDLEKNAPIVCLTLCKQNDDRVSEFVLEQHRDLFHYMFVNKSIALGKVDDLNKYRTNFKYCSNYDPNILVDTQQKIKLFSFICKKHSRKCTSKTCEGIGIKCGFYRSLYHSRAPKSKHQCRIHLHKYPQMEAISPKKLTFADISSISTTSAKTLKSAIHINNRHNLSQPKEVKIEYGNKDDLLEEVLATEIYPDLLPQNVTIEMFRNELTKRNPRLEATPTGKIVLKKTVIESTSTSLVGTAPIFAKDCALSEETRQPSTSNFHINSANTISPHENKDPNLENYLDLIEKSKLPSSMQPVKDDGTTVTLVNASDTVVREKTRQPSTSSFTSVDNSPAIGKTFAAFPRFLEARQKLAKSREMVNAQLDVTKWIKPQTKNAGPAPVSQPVLVWKQRNWKDETPRRSFSVPATFTNSGTDAAQSSHATTPAALTANEPSQLVKQSPVGKKFIDCLENILETMLETKGKYTQLGSAAEFREICQKACPHLKPSSVKQTFYRDVLRKLTTFRNRILKMKDGEACYAWLENWSAKIKADKE